MDPFVFGRRELPQAILEFQVVVFVCWAASRVR
jgi:hypothetical protein